MAKTPKTAWGKSAKNPWGPKQSRQPTVGNRAWKAPTKGAPRTQKPVEFRKAVVTKEWFGFLHPKEQPRERLKGHRCPKCGEEMMFDGYKMVHADTGTVRCCRGMCKCGEEVQLQGKTAGGRNRWVHVQSGTQSCPKRRNPYR